MVGKWVADWDFQRRTTSHLCDTSTSTKEDGNYGWKVGRRLGFCEKNHATTLRHLHVDERGRQLWLESGSPSGIFREEPRHDFATPPRRRKRTATMVGKWVADWDFVRRTTPRLCDTSTSTKEDGNYCWKVGRRLGFCEKNHPTRLAPPPPPKKEAGNYGGKVGRRLGFWEKTHATTLRHLHVDERGRQL